MGLKQTIKKTCKSAPAWASGPHGPCTFRSSLSLEIESDRDKISLDCFPSLRTINMYPLLFVKGASSQLANNNSRRITTPNPRVFIQVSAMLPWSLLVIRAVLFLLLPWYYSYWSVFMASSTSYLDVRSTTFNRSVVICCLSSTNIMLSLRDHVIILY